MSTLNYNRTILATYKRAAKEKTEDSNIEWVLRLPHPQREIAFIDWALGMTHSKGADLAVTTTAY
jgi:hypothetical protein